MPFTDIIFMKCRKDSSGPLPLYISIFRSLGLPFAFRQIAILVQHQTEELDVSYLHYTFQDSLDQFPMPVNTSQYQGIYLTYPSILIIENQCQSILLNTHQCWTMPDQISSIWHLLALIDIEKYWEALIGIGLYWWALGPTMQLWSVLISIDLHWALIEGALTFLCVWSGVDKWPVILAVSYACWFPSQYA